MGTNTQKNSGVCSETDKSSDGMKNHITEKDFLQTFAFIALTQDLVSPAFLEIFLRKLLRFLHIGSKCHPDNLFAPNQSNNLNTATINLGQYQMREINNLQV